MVATFSVLSRPHGLIVWSCLVRDSAQLKTTSQIDAEAVEAALCYDLPFDQQSRLIPIRMRTNRKHHPQFSFIRELGDKSQYTEDMFLFHRFASCCSRLRGPAAVERRGRAVTCRLSTHTYPRSWVMIIWMESQTYEKPSLSNVSNFSVASIVGPPFTRLYHWVARREMLSLHFLNK